VDYEINNAMMWSGTAASAVNLNPTGYNSSAATAISGSNIVGYGVPAAVNHYHAMLWSGSSSVTDLNPSGFTSSFANAITGTQIVGYGIGSTGDTNAIYWNGSSASSAVDLELPSSSPGFIPSTVALGVGGPEQVGYGNTVQALLWTGTAASVVSLAPTSSSPYANWISEACGTNGVQQVGHINGSTQVAAWVFSSLATVWYGSAASMVNLQSSLPSTGSWLASAACSVDSSHNIFGWAYGTYNGTTGYFATEWSTPTLNFTGASATWNINSATNFNSGSAATVYYDGDFVSFDDAHNTGSQYTITLTSGPGSANFYNSVSPGSISVTTVHTYTFNGVGIGGVGTLTKSGTGTLILNNVNTFTGATTINQGTITLGAAGSLADSPITVGTGSVAGILNLTASSSGILVRDFTALTNTTTGTVNVLAGAGTARALLVIANNGLLNSGKIDLGNNDMDLPLASLSTITAEIQQGYSAGGWNGSAGICSSSASANTRHLTAIGVILNGTTYGNSYGTLRSFDGIYPASTDVLVKYTYYGDANLDGAVDGSDYTLIDNGYHKHLTGWGNGDFDYDGVVDGSDYTLIDNAYNTQGTTLGSNPATLIAAIATQIASSSSVPEPVDLSLTTIAGFGFLLKRRRGI
jgi:autotransporter-associated beta strand protein